MLCNAFSLNMLPAGFVGSVAVAPATADDARAALVTGGSSVGHADTAAVLSDVLGVAVPTVRSTVTLAPGATIVVAQYSGPRLPEGCKTLPAGARIVFSRVSI